MKQILSIIGYALLIVVITVLIVWYQVFQYKLCQKVTHGGFWYCLQHASH